MIVVKEKFTLIVVKGKFTFLLFGVKWGLVGLIPSKKLLLLSVLKINFCVSMTAS